MNDAITERVASGAAFLDQHRPGWADRLNLITLDLHNAECCVIGQEYGDFYKGKLALGLTYDGAERLGFYVAWRSSWSRRFADYADLTDEWRRVLTERRAAVAS